MNVAEINPGSLETIRNYVATAVPFTIVTVWVIIAFQSKYIFKTEVSFWWRLTWPFQLIYERYIRKPKKTPTEDTFAMTEEPDKDYVINVERAGSLDVEMLPVAHSRSPYGTTQ
jgi:hypothetical protein